MTLRLEALLMRETSRAIPFALSMVWEQELNQMKVER
jgi:hypothetical protein